jgi:hypothetical protein
MDGRGLQCDDHLIATGNERRLGNKRHDLGNEKTVPSLRPRRAL